jgi:hypothetical protein
LIDGCISRPAAPDLRRPPELSTVVLLPEDGAIVALGHSPAAFRQGLSASEYIEGKHAIEYRFSPTANLRDRRHLRRAGGPRALPARRIHPV